MDQNEMEKVMTTSIYRTRALLFTLTLCMLFLPLNGKAQQNIAPPPNSSGQPVQVIGAYPDLEPEQGMDLLVRVEENRISIKAKDVPARTILEEIARQQGIQLSFSKGFPSLTVTDQFTALPMKKALSRLLKGSSYSLVYNEDDSIKELHILPSGKSGFVPAPPPPQEEIVELLQEENLPDTVNEEMEKNKDTEELTEELSEESTEAIERLVDNLEESGLDNSEVTKDLKRQLEEKAAGDE